MHIQIGNIVTSLDAIGRHRVGELMDLARIDVKRFICF